MRKGLKVGIKTYTVVGEHYIIREAISGHFVKYSDHKKALAETKAQGAREFLEKILAFECKEMDCGKCPEENDIMCSLNSTVRTYGIDKVIQKVEGI